MSGLVRAIRREFRLIRRRPALISVNGGAISGHAAE